MNTGELRREIDHQRRVLRELEDELRTREREERDRTWFPRGFYAAYYLLSGMVLGVIASWVTLALNVLGAALFEDDPLKLLRVYSTILGGAETYGSRQAVVIIFALGLHTATGAICGAPIHVFYSRFFMGQRPFTRLLTGLWLGVVMWLVNFYAILYWFQPFLLGTEASYIVENTPPWVAALTHIAFTETVLLLQPFAVFNTRSYPAAGPAGEGPAAGAEG
jgi:hypothetical protein